MTAPDLALGAATPAGWAEGVAPHLDTLLLDQAHLEKKAAAAASSFLFRLPPDLQVQLALSRLAREELLHFERTLQLLQQRGIAFANLQPSAYAERLKRALSTSMPQRRCDELLLAAVIEARSHERMQALARELQPREPQVAAFYFELVDAEARHAGVYTRIAAQLFGEAMVAARAAAIAAHEAMVLRSLPFQPRLHGGAPEALDVG